MPHLLRLAVSDSDIDELGHASNLCYVRWVLEAALDHSRAAGINAADYRARGQCFVVRRHELDYLRPALCGDVLIVETRVVAMRPASSTRETTIHREGDGALLLRARTGWAFIDLASGRPTRIPGDVRARFPLDPPVLEATT